MEVRSDMRRRAGPKALSVWESAARFRRGKSVCPGVSRRSALLTISGMLLAGALSACAEKPPPAEVTPFAFPAVGAGQKDTAQFGARSGPTVP